MNPEERKRYQSRLLIFYGLIFVMIATLVSGLAYKQLIESGLYAERELKQNHRRILRPGPRGNIYDREGRVLVTNKPKYSAVVFVKDPSVRKAFQDEYKVLKNDLLSSGKKYSYGNLVKEARANVIQSYLDDVNAMLDRDESVDANALSRHILIDPHLPFTIIENLTRDEFAVLIESLPVESSIQMYASSTRHYPYESAAAHVLGYVSSSTLEEDGDLPGKGLHTRATKGSYGRDGVEKQFDDRLKGVTGMEIWVVDKVGLPVETIKQIYPKQGEDLYLSLDVDLQLAAEQNFDLYGDKGALVALDIKRMEILAMVSKPDYNLNGTSPRFSAATLKKINESGAWENKALRGAFAPGSPFKIVNAIAALKAGVIDEHTVFDCKNAFKVGNRMFHCHSGSVHGEITLLTAIQKSCNVYFYNAGLQTGVDNLSREAIYLGLNDRTGIDLPNETSHMRVPTREWKKKRIGENWYGGDTANMSIGQGDLLATPLQMAVLAASIAENKVLTQPTILHQTDEMLKARPVPKPLGLPDNIHELIVKGMDMVVSNEGTAKFAQVKGVTVAGKTGTAQVRKDGGFIENAWFVCFAPVEDPQIAIAVIKEGYEVGRSHGGGTNAAPMAQSVLKTYFAKKPAITPATADVSLP